MAKKRERFKKMQNKNTPIKRMDKKHKEEFNRVRKNALSKLNRIKKTFGNDLVVSITNQKGEVLYDNVTPDYLIKIPKLNELKTWEEYHNFVEKAKSFTKRQNMRFQFEKNDEGIVASKTVLNRIKKNNKRAINEANKKIESYVDVPTQEGRTTYGQRLPMMGHPEVGGIRPPVPFEFGDITSKQRLLEVARNMEKRANTDYFAWRNNIYKDNLLFVVGKAFNSDANDVLEMLKNMSSSDLFDMSIRYKELDINYYYPTKGVIQAEDQDLERLRSYLQAYQKDEINFDMKDFPNG